MLIVLVIATGLAWCGFVMRFKVREFLAQRRIGAIGEQTWFEVVQESGKKSGTYSSSSFEGVRILAQFLNGFGLLSRRARGKITFVWMKSASDPGKLTRLYVGVNSESGESGTSALRSYAKSIGARLQPAPNVTFPNQGVAVARVKDVYPSKAKDTVDEIGVVSESIASIADEMRSDDSCAVMMTLDGMGSKERDGLANAIMTKALSHSGDNSFAASSIAPAVRQMTEGSVRLGLSAATSSGNISLSRSLVSATVESTSTLAYDVQLDMPETIHSRWSVVYGIPTAAFAVISFIMGNWFAGIAGVAIVAAVAAATFLWPESVAGPMSRAAARGETLMPDYLPRPFSLRRGLHRLIMRSRSKGNEGTAPEPFPSPEEALSCHPAAMFEMLTFSQSATLTAGDRLQSRGLPPDMIDVDEGIFIGMSGTQQPILLDMEDVHLSLYTAGAPNSGKSNLLLVLFAGMVKASRDKISGMSISPIWGETKGEGAYQAFRIARNHPRAAFIDVHNPNGGARLALEGKRLSEGETVENVIANCTRLVSGQQAAYGDGIKSQAREIFDNVLRCTMLMNPDEIRFAGLDGVVNPAKPNIMELSFFLLLGDSRIDPSQKMLALGATLSAQGGLREMELARAIGSMSRFWQEGPDRRTYAERISTVLNKINDMRNAPLLWTPDGRQDVYIRQIVQSFAPTVINMGSYYHSETRQYRQTIDRSVSQRLIRTFNYLLWDYIKTNCNGWQEERKRVPMFFDEVADVAVNAEGEDVPNTLEEGTKEGRSRGAAYFLGSQYPSQMPDMVRHQVLASRGKLWFTQQNSSDLALAVDDLMTRDAADGEGAITQSNIKSLKDGKCFATIPRRGEVTPPFLLHVPYAPVWTKFLFSEGNVDTNDAVADYVQHIDMKSEGVEA